eukprot:TRINITY_DN14386_c0_g1_i1.p1 TRINITY_DN14386_c0_g1~~TRINITY_DN14386_c0_g1_i1.p1  ORF type:complete len:266 (+),score=65.99 TRINITY_DN14386_c0_g1_i1:880-1677(+)
MYSALISSGINAEYMGKGINSEILTMNYEEQVQSPQSPLSPQGFATPEDSNRFSRRVLLFFFLQWIIHFIVVASVYDARGNYNFHRQNWGVDLGAAIIWVAIPLIVGCFRAGRNVPLVLVIAFVFTVVTSWLWTALLSFFNPQVILYIVALLTTISGGLFVAAAISKQNLSVITGLLFTLFASFIVYEAFVIFSSLSFGALVITALLLVVVGVFIVYDIQMILPGPSYALAVNNTVSGSVVLWLDIVLIFVRICEIIGRNMRKGF